METLKQYKGTISALLLFGGLFFVYTNFIQGTGADPLFSSEKISDVEGVVAGQEIIALLEELQGIRLNVALFENDSFNTLIDFRQDITSESIGRSNPFTSIGAANVSGAVARPIPDVVQTIGSPTQ